VRAVFRHGILCPGIPVVQLIERPVFGGYRCAGYGVAVRLHERASFEVYETISRPDNLPAFQLITPHSSFIIDIFPHTDASPPINDNP